MRYKPTVNSALDCKVITQFGLQGMSTVLDWKVFRIGLPWYLSACEEC